MKTIILYGLKRSGNHFLISTILQQFSNCVHINNVKLSYDKYIEWKNIEKTKERIDCDWTGFKGVECVVISLENKIIDNNEFDKFKNIDNCNFLMLLRCPYCNFSSVWKVYNKNENKLRLSVKLWKIYAKYFLNNNEVIKVLYDELATNNNYMYDVLKKLGIDNIKKVDNNKYIKWQLSSFKKNKTKQKQVYKTLENCIFKDDKDFIRLVKDKEIDNLWNLSRKVGIEMSSV